ncbi:MAG: hypothetical protein ABH874_05370 [Methanobacteriota archaeon]
MEHKPGRIKLMSYAYQKGRILPLRLNFTDRYNNRFLWTVNSRDIGDLFSKAIEIEKRNLPNGSYVLFFTDLLKTLAEIRRGELGQRKISQFTESDTEILKNSVQLKFVGYSHSFLPKIILLELDFESDSGIKLRWCPEWEDVMSFILEIVQTYGCLDIFMKKLVRMYASRKSRGDVTLKQELMDRFMEKALLASYLEEKLLSGKVYKNVRLGPTETHFKKIGRKPQR